MKEFDMNESLFVVDEEKCIHCGLCINECIEHAIAFDDNKFPKMYNSQMCINCQHCFAVCPVGAISFNSKCSSLADNISIYNSIDLLNLIKSRRSDRHFKDENIDNIKLTKLKDMLKWVPTGCNFHKLQFSFIDDISVMNDFRDKVNKKLKSEIESNEDLTKKFGIFKSDILRGEDLIFRGAPHILVVSNDKNAPCSIEDGIIALSYFELYAQSLGLGTCWCGFMKAIVNFFPEFINYLEIPDNYNFCYAILFGEKTVKFARTTLPDDVIIKSVTRK